MEQNKMLTHDKFTFSLVEYIARKAKEAGFRAELLSNDMLTVYEDECVPVYFLDCWQGRGLVSHDYQSNRRASYRSEESVKRSMRRMVAKEKARQAYEASIIDMLVTETFNVAQYDAAGVDWLVEQA